MDPGVSHTTNNARYHGVDERHPKLLSAHLRTSTPQRVSTTAAKGALPSGAEVPILPWA